MNKEQTLSLLGLESSATDSKIEATYQQKKAQIGKGDRELGQIYFLRHFTQEVGSLFRVKGAS